MTGPQGACLLAPVRFGAANWKRAIEVDVQPLRVKPVALAALTDRQRRIACFVATHIAEHGYSPTFVEIAKACGLRSTSSVSHQIGVLRRLGVLAEAEADEYARPRSLRLVRPGDVA